MLGVDKEVFDGKGGGEGSKIDGLLILSFSCLGALKWVDLFLKPKKMLLSASKMETGL